MRLLLLCILAGSAAAINLKETYPVKDPQAQQTPGTCHSCQLQPGDTVLLTGPPPQHCKRRAAARSRSAQPPACTAEELTLHVISLLGKGAVAEVYEVTVLRHVLPAAAAGAGSNDPATPAAEQDGVTPAHPPPPAAPAATTEEDASHHKPEPPAPAPAPAAAAAAAPAGPLQDLHLALRVCQRWEALPRAVQIRVYADDASTYEGLVSNNMQASHWAMSSPVLGAGTHILRSRVLGSIRRVPKPAADSTATAGPEAPDPAAAAAVEVVAPSPALLMDLAEGGSLRQQIDRMRDGQQGLQEPGVLSQAHAHRIVKDCLQTLDRLHAAGWVYLDLYPSNLVSLHKDEGEAAVVQDRKAVRGDTSSEQAAALRAGSAHDELPGHLLVDFSSAFFLGGAEHRKHYKPLSTYTSPELLLSSTASKAADIWALGMLLLELRSGDRSVVRYVLDDGGEPGGLWDKAAHASTLQALRQQEKFTGLTDTEWSFVVRCLTFDWQQRPSARELLRDAYVVHGAGVL